MPQIRAFLDTYQLKLQSVSADVNRNKSREIPKGELCLVILTKATNNKYNYASENAQPILDKAWRRLAEFYAALGLRLPSES